MIVNFAARSHIGRVREENEDNLFIDGLCMTREEHNCPFALDGNLHAPLVMAVCDGMGGEENGEIASFLTVEALRGVYTSFKEKSNRQNLQERVQQFVDAARLEIQSAYENRGKRVGTTLVMAIISHRGIHCFSVGDSRIYCLHGGKLRQITNDHTVATELGLSRSDLENLTLQEKNKQKLTRCIGIGSKCEVEGYPPIYGRVRLLLCSDGLTGMVSFQNIEKVLKEFAQPRDAVDRLLSEAMEKGGRDNITVVVADAVILPAFMSRAVGKCFRKK